MSVNAKSILFRLVAAALPLFVILILEVVLRASGVDQDRRTPFRPVDGHSDQLVLNATYTQRYFNSFAPGVAFTPFSETKPDDTFRVFALGGSTTAGFPTNGYAFPFLLRSRLESFLPDLRTEMVSLALTATNSYTIWDLSRDVTAFQPDAVVIYAGHNEYYGAFGAGTSINRLGNRVWLKRLVIRLKRSAVYSLMERLIAGLARSGDVVGRTMMAEAVGESSIPLDSGTFARGVRQFEDNMTEAVSRFCAVGVPVYLATLTSNLSGQPPLGEDPRAREAFADGVRRLEIGDIEGARKRLEEARDLDDLRFRAPGVLNRSIRRLAETSCARLVDVDRAFQEAAISGVEGSDLFVDHLHPTVAGHDLMARVFFEEMLGHHRLRGGPVLGVPAGAPVVDRVDAAAARLRIARLMMGRPFVRDLTPEGEAEAYRSFVRSFVRTSLIDSLAALSVLGEVTEDEAFEQAIAYARFGADTLEVLRMYRSLLGRRPFNGTMAQEALLFGLKSRSAAPLVRDIASMWANRSREPFYLQALTAALLNLGAAGDAETLLDWAKSHGSDGDFRTRVLRGDNLRRAGRLSEAVGAYEAALELRPGDLALQNNIATAYLQLGNPSEALARYTAVLASDSTFVEAWINLALFYARAGQRERANAALARVMSLDPDHPVLRRLRSR